MKLAQLHFSWEILGQKAMFARDSGKTKVKLGSDLTLNEI